MPAAAPQGGQGDNSSGLIWGVVAFLAAIVGTWYAFHQQIIRIYLDIKLVELRVAQFIYSPFGARFEYLTNKLQTALADPSVITFYDLYNLGNAVGVWWRIPLAVILVVLAVVVYFGNTARMFRNTYSMKSFSSMESENWPQITPVIGLDLINTDIGTGPWAMALNPMQFCKRYKLLDEVIPERKEGMSRNEWKRVDVVVRRGEANKIFSMQLGQLWEGADKLPMHAKALFAAFAARGNADTKPATELLLRLSRTCKTKLDYTGVDELLKKHENSKLVRNVIENHAYVYTVMASMLELAREDGVQASSDFLWLKPKDRRLWYILNTVGRQTPFIEVAGIFAHWVAEKEAERRLIVPMVEEATNAVVLAIKDIVYKREDDEN